MHICLCVLMYVHKAKCQIRCIFMYLYTCRNVSVCMKIYFQSIVKIFMSNDKLSCFNGSLFNYLIDDGNLSVASKVIQVKLDKENDSFGFTLRGGSCNNRLKSRPLIITHVRFGSPANR